MTWETAGFSPFAGRIRALFRHAGEQMTRDCERDLLQQERLQERARIARELHDTLLQGILSASMQLHVAEGYLPADSPAKPALSRVLDLLGKGIAEGRAALHGLRSPGIPSTNLERALCDLTEELSPSDRARLRVLVIGEPKELDPVLQEQLYRITREALLNALRHSGASRIEAELEFLRRKLRVVVRDNGCGIAPQALRSAKDSHWGLEGMHERAAGIGAKLRVWSRPAAGTELELTVRLGK